MPELPEAETVCRALDRALTGRTILRAEIFSPAMRTSLEPLKNAGLEGAVFNGVSRRGRYLLASLSGEKVLVMHLGMSGVIRVEPASVPRRKHEHVFFHLSDGNIFRFECTRRFSLLELHSPGKDGIPEMLSRLGVEPLSDDFTGEYFFSACRLRRTPVKTLLMDNAIVTGIGNIYAAETLFESGVYPGKTGNSLTLDECSKIVCNAKKILEKAIEAGGSTISDFRHVDGSEGKFARTLKIYGKEGEKCPVCGNKIECMKIGGRSSCFCGECQK